MAVRFDSPTRLGQTVSALLLRPVAERKVTPVVVDAGARNGMAELPASYARTAELIAFEPNPEEHRKLVAGETDAARAGYAAPPFRAETYHPYALWREEEERPFYVTAGAGACTLMGAADPAVTDKMFVDGSTRSYGADHTEVRRTEPVPCRPLDALIGRDTVIDYLKIDVEGAEHDLLTGAQGLLGEGRALLIKSEFVLTPYYARHPVLGHQHALLDAAGYRMIDMDLNHGRYSRGRTTVPARADRRLIYAGDAFYMRDPDRNAMDAEARHRLATVALALGFNSLGVGLLREAGWLPAAEIDAIEAAAATLPLSIRLKKAWDQVPYAVARQLARLRG